MKPHLDGGTPFDWGRTSPDYARYRDIYPPEYYETVRSFGIGRPGQRLLDMGTGTGVLPRHLQGPDVHWTGIDASPDQIEQAKSLSAGMDIVYETQAAEEFRAPPGSFDAAVAAQCFFYFDHEQLAPRLARLLVSGGNVLITYLSWLPEEDPIAAASEELVLAHNPSWSGGGETFRPVEVPPEYRTDFRVSVRREERLAVPFTRESWHGRMRACRGTGASLSPEALRAWEEEHRALLDDIAPDTFTVQHCFALALLEKR